MLAQQGQHSACVGAYGVFHSGVEAVVDMRQDNVETRAKLAEGLDRTEPVLLHALSEAGAEGEKFAQGPGIGAFAPEFDRVPAGLSVELGANVVVHRRES